MDFTEALASLQDPDPGVLVEVKTAVKWLDVINAIQRALKYMNKGV